MTRSGSEQVVCEEKNRSARSFLFLRDIFFRILVKAFLAAHRAKIISLTFIFGPSLSGLKSDVHAADGVFQSCSHFRFSFTLDTTKYCTYILRLTEIPSIRAYPARIGKSPLAFAVIKSGTTASRPAFSTHL